MIQQQQGRSSCHIHQANGEVRVIRPTDEAPSDDLVGEPPRRPSEVPVASIMTRHIICAQRTLGIDKLVPLMVRKHIGCLPVVNERGKPVGMVTKLDLVERMFDLPKQPAPKTAEDLMMPLALTVNERATVAHATAMMALEDVHHVLVVSEAGAVIGIVSSLDIARWLARNEGMMSDQRATAGWREPR
jgi:CBS-domain-containing membrane protein